MPHFNSETFWICIGMIGQAMFSMRFIVQWIVSEKAKKSIIPNLFWYFSVSGGSLLLAYSLYRQDPIFILGQSMGLFVYLRNLYLIIREKNVVQV